MVWARGKRYSHDRRIVPILAIILSIVMLAAHSGRADTIIDNTSTSTSRTGTWTASGAAGYYGTGSVWSRDGATFTWLFTASSTAQYDVWMWWTAWSSRSTNIPVDIEHAGGTARVYIDQSANGGIWNLLGRYTFTAGQTYRVTITAQSDPTSTCADAVKFSEATSVEAGVIDNTDSSTSRTGTWTASSATGYYGTGSLWARDGATFTWIFTPSQTGAYSLAMWWTTWPSRSSNIPVDIEYAGGVARVYINQLANGSQWNTLGTWAFAAGTSWRITVTAQADPTSTCADAVRLTYTGTVDLPPVAQIVSIAPSPAMPGQTVVMQGKGITSDGTVTGYNWRSSINGTLGTSATISVSNLSQGVHTIYLKVRDGQGVWSAETSATLSVGGEDIYIAMPYNDDDPRPQFLSMFKNMGVVQQGSIWVYTNTAGKVFRMHWVESNAALRQALKTEGAHILIEGHSNYGLGPVFATSAEIRNATVYGVYYIDDPRIFRCSSPWIAIDVKDFILEQAYPDWWPEFSDGTSGIMPYTFGSAAGDPPYNYYETYQVPGDSTWYRIDSLSNAPLQRFPDCGKPAWYSPTGSTPNPNSSSDRQYYLTNSAPWYQYYPKPHYKAKTIIHRRDPELQPSELKYSRLMYNSCGSGYYYAPFFNRGIMFYTLGSQASGDNTVIYLRNYLQGKSDYAIWQVLQKIEPVYDYYNFNKPPALQAGLAAESEMSAAATEPNVSTMVATAEQITTVTATTEPNVTMVAVAEPNAPATAQAAVQTASVAIAEANDPLAGLSLDEVIERLKGMDFFGDEDRTCQAIQTCLAADSNEAIAKALATIARPAEDSATTHRSHDSYVARMILKTFAAQSADRLIALYRSGDNTTRGNVLHAAGDMVDVNSVRSLLIESLGNTSTCEPNRAEMAGWPLRICDVAYNQLTLHLKLRKVVRTIGTNMPLDQRDQSIARLKQRLSR